MTRQPSLSETTAPNPIPPDPPQRHLWSPTSATPGPDHQHGQPPIPTQQPQRLEDEEKGEGPPEPSLQPKTAAPPLANRPITHFYTVSYLIFFAIFGTLARLGLQALTFYPGAPVVTGVLWANVAGSLVMGFLLEDRRIFREEWGTSSWEENGEDAHERHKKHKTTKKSIPLYIGLTTGFCGCLTSFSSFIRDVFLALANALPDPSRGRGNASRNGGYSFMALVAVILITVSLSLSALVFGAHLALALGPVTPVLPFRFTRHVLDPLFVVLGWGCWLGTVFMAIWPPDRHTSSAETWRDRAVFSIVFAPLGCLTRFYLSLSLNARLPRFPLGTFASNIFGTLIEGMAYDLQHVGYLAGSAAGAGSRARVSCQVLQGVMDGFCGSTTTVSTWVAELNGLGRRRDAYTYGVGSVGVALGCLVVVMGSLLWTRGFDTPACA